jgi:hypothetical protein
MKPLFWMGLLVLILGFASFVVKIPSTERQGVEAGGISMGIETHTEDKVSPFLTAVMILGGAGMMIAGKGKR